MNTKNFILTPKTWIVTAFPPKKNLVPRFESRKGLEGQIGSRKVWRVFTKAKSQSSKLLLLLYNESVGFKTSQPSFFLYQLHWFARSSLFWEVGRGRDSWEKNIY